MPEKQLGDRLSISSRRQFVGRAIETALFQSVLAFELRSSSLIYISGASGVGKTCLLNEFTVICQQLNIPSLYIDARNIAVNPAAFLSVLQATAECGEEDLYELISGKNQDYVILIDNYERLTPLTNWLQEFWSQLPKNTVVVLASQTPLTINGDAAYVRQPLSYILELNNFSLEESQIYLQHREIPTDECDRVFNLTQGHPLTLSLVADVFSQSHQILPSAEISILLKQFISQTPASGRIALAICAVAYVTTKELLLSFGIAEECELYNWLQGLSFIEFSPLGLFPHDSVRFAASACTSNLSNSVRYQVRDYSIQRIIQTQGQQQQSAVDDYLFATQLSPSNFKQPPNIFIDTLLASDFSSLAAMVANHEGEAAAQLFGYWLGRQPHGVTVVRRADSGNPVGFMMLLDVQALKLADLQVDPATNTVWNYLQFQPVLLPQEKVTLCRFWMAADTYQQVSPVQSLLFMHAFRQYVTTPSLAFIFMAVAAPEWQHYQSLLTDADFIVSGRNYGMYIHNFREVPLSEWLVQPPEWLLGVNPSQDHVSFSKSEFTIAVKQALRDFSHPEALSQNPLLNSRLVAHSPASDRLAAFQTLLQQTVELLQRSHRETKFYQALIHTYLHPAKSQEQAAEILDISIGSLRRHLKAGIIAVTEILWDYQINTQRP